MGKAAEANQFDHLRINHHQPELVWGIVADQAGGDRLDADRLTGTGGPAYQEMRHLAQIGCHRLAGDIVAQRNTQGGIQGLEGAGLHHLPESDDLDVLIGDLDADEGPAGHRRLDAQARGGQREGQILGALADLADAHLSVTGASTFDKPGLHPELRHSRAHAHLDDLHGERELGQRLLDDPRLVPNL